MSLVLDASIALSWCFEDEDDALATGVLAKLRTSEAVVPALWTLEVANGLVTAERHGRIAPSEAAAFSALLLSLPIAIDPSERSRASSSVLPLARAHGLSAYDGTYLELAARLGLPVATLDERLARAAREIGVGVFEA